jgi:hypothetical protein
MKFSIIPVSLAVLAMAAPPQTPEGFLEALDINAVGERYNYRVVLITRDEAKHTLLSPRGDDGYSQC